MGWKNSKHYFSTSFAAMLQNKMQVARFIVKLFICFLVSQTHKIKKFKINDFVFALYCR